MRLLCLLLSFAAAIAHAAPPAAVTLSAARRLSFNDGWRFARGEFAGAEQTAFDDSAWRILTLPHDWAIEGPFDKSINAHEGGLPYFGTGWYRKSFTLAANSRDRFVRIEFDGAMANSRVWLNGDELGGRPYGYIGFSFDLTPHLHFDGKPNVIAVRLAPEPKSSRWYPGAGLYRNVWLDVTSFISVDRWGTYITTPEVTPDKATVAVRIDLVNRRPNAAVVTVETSILNSAGARVAVVRRQHKVAGKDTLSQTLVVPKPSRWDTAHPYLYTARTRVISGATTLDSYDTPFGIRTIAFDRQRGFLLNGRVTKLHGVCLHHDLGALGAAVNRRATERQLQIMKSLGVNAIRTSHNPPSPELLEFSDRLGLLVMDEAFDVWRVPKVPNGYQKYFDLWGETDLRDMLRRDRNHPSVILWSIGNEVNDQAKPEGAQIAERLTKICHQEDPSRLVTAAFNQWENAIRNGLADKVDIPGFNYQPMHYEQILRDHPNWIILGTETASTVSSRGVYHFPLEDYAHHDSLQVTSYDVVAPPWATLPDVEFAAQDRFPQIPGEFVWTGFDYIGEPTPFNTKGNNDWPSRSSYFGIVDLAGFPKDRYYFYQSVWTNTPMVHALPHWNWPGMDGKTIPVMAYTNCEEAELFVNGKSFGRQRRGAKQITLPVGKNTSPDRTFQSKYRLLWDVPYQPGELKVVAYNKGRQAAVHTIRTAGPPARLVLSPDRASLKADGDDLSFITVRVEDKEGNLCPLAANEIRFRLEGPAALAAVDNGNAATVDPFHADRRQAFNGLALLIVRTRRAEPGTVRVLASAEGLTSAETILTSIR